MASDKVLVKKQLRSYATATPPLSGKQAKNSLQLTTDQVG